MSNNEDFIVISDFHSMWEPYYKLENYYIFDYNNIYILGDVTDRGEDGKGTDGVKILLSIMELDKKIQALPKEAREKDHIGNVHYIPGNHDDFLYEYALLQDKNAKENMKINHGEQTIKDIDDLRRKDSNRLRELAEWLGNKPLQVKHVGKDGKVYCLAHAFFDDFLYSQNKNYSLSDKLRAKHLYNSLFNVIWFRKGQDSYQSFRVPSSDNIGIIGHTPSMLNPNTRNFDLDGSDGKTFRVMNVDGGLAYGGNMLEYSGGDSIIKANRFDIEELEKIKKKKYPYYSIDDIFDKYLSPTQKSYKKENNCLLDYNSFLEILRKLNCDCSLFLNERSTDCGEKMLDSLYKMIIMDSDYQNLHLNYNMFYELIVYNNIFNILATMLFENNINDKKVLKDFITWLKTNKMNYGYSESVYTLSSKINSDIVIEYLNNQKELDEIFAYAKKYIDQKKVIQKQIDSGLSVKEKPSPIILPKSFIELFNSNGYQEQDYKNKDGQYFLSFSKKRTF